MRFSIVLLAISLLFACQPTEQQEGNGRLHVNSDFIKAFGRPEQPRSGEAWGVVGYYPFRDRPELLRPVPLFLFRSSSQLRLVLSRLVAPEFEMSPRTGMLNPFPAGTELLYANPIAGVLEIDLSLPPEESVNRMMIASIAETALQFPEVRAVKFSRSGKPLPGFPGPMQSRPEQLSEPGPPLLLMLARVAAQEAGSEDILVSFDRPLTLDELVLSTQDGRLMAGKYFQSIFNMAAVFRPQPGLKLPAGTSIRIDWRVTDGLGRVGQGRDLVSLD